MSINSDQFQALVSPKAADTILMANSAGGTAQLSLTNLAKFLAEQDNPVKTALSSKAALAATDGEPICTTDGVEINAVKYL